MFAEQGERETLPEPLDCQLPSVVSNTFGADVLIWGCHNLIPCDDILGLYFLLYVYWWFWVLNPAP